MEFLLMLWKTVAKAVRDFFVVPAVSEDKKTPYRTPVPSDPKAELKLVCTLTNDTNQSVASVDKVKEKSRRRALRHFRGEEVKHRVTEKTPDFIEFEFFRTPDKSHSVKIRWQKINTPTQPITSP
jgi:hypothetical protein